LKKKWEHYSVHFYSTQVAALLKTAVEKVAKKRDRFDILDLGCGDGRMLFGLQQEGVLRQAGNITGVDISEVRINRLKQNIQRAVGIISDACSVTEMKDKSFDMIICSQVIEHVPNDALLVKEIVRLLRPDGYAYISSVVKRKYGLWIYRNRGKFRVDPTHVREYESTEEFTRLLKSNGLMPEEVVLVPIKYSISEIIIRLLILLNIYRSDNVSDIFRRHSFVNSLRRISIPVPGYSVVEAVCRANALSKVYD